MCFGLRINEWTTRSKSQSRFDWINCSRIFQRWRGKRCVTFRWQYFQIYLSMLWGVSFVRSYPIRRRLSTYFGYRFRLIIRKNYHHQDRFYYFSVGYLRACRRSYRSCTCHNIRPFGCYYCVKQSSYRIRYLSCCRSSWFYIQNDGPLRCRRETLLMRKKHIKIALRLQKFTRYYCYFGYGRTVRRR